MKPKITAEQYERLEDRVLMRREREATLTPRQSASLQRFGKPTARVRLWAEGSCPADLLARDL